MRIIASGFRGAEGPVVLPNFSYGLTHDDGIAEVTPDGRVTTWATTGWDPNGLVLDDSGAVWVANNGLVCREGKVPGRIQRVAPDGRVTDVALGLEAPNDLAIGPDGSIWFTDPVVCILDPTDRRPGRVHRMDDDGLTLVHEGLDFPNGIGFTAAGELIVAETQTGLLQAIQDGQPTPWLKLPSGGPDGFTFATDGTGFVCCYDVGLIYVIDAAGRVIDSLSTGPDTWPTNCILDDNGCLIVTEAKVGQLLAFDVGCRPQPTPSTNVGGAA